MSYTLLIIKSSGFNSNQPHLTTLLNIPYSFMCINCRVKL